MCVCVCCDCGAADLEVTLRQTLTVEHILASLPVSPAPDGSQEELGLWLGGQDRCMQCMRPDSVWS